MDGLTIRVGRALKHALAILLILAGCARASADTPFAQEDTSRQPALAGWLALWPPSPGQLSASSFRLVRESDGIGTPSDDFAVRSASFASRHMDRFVWSPDSTWAVDPWFGQVDADGRFLGEPDAPIGLLNRVSGEARLLLDCGTACGFHAVIWLGDSRLLVAGWEESPYAPPGDIVPVIWRFDLIRRRCETFAGPAVGARYAEPLGIAARQLWRVWFPWLSFARAAGEPEGEASDVADEDRRAAGDTVSMAGDTVASVTVCLPKSTPRPLDANVDYASVGPSRSFVTNARRDGGFSLETPSGPVMLPVARRLRAMICSCERSSWLLIDDIVVGRADSRAVRAEYRLDPLAVGELWARTRQVRRTRRAAAADPPIVWIGSTSFAWVMPTDTLFVEQKADSLFRVTLKPCVR